MQTQVETQTRTQVETDTGRDTGANTDTGAGRHRYWHIHRRKPRLVHTYGLRYGRDTGTGETQTQTQMRRTDR